MKRRSKPVAALVGNIANNPMPICLISTMPQIIWVMQNGYGL